MGWIFSGLMWNFRLPGLLLAGTVMGGLTFTLIRRAVRFCPEVRDESLRQSPARRGATFLRGLAFLIPGYLCFIMAAVSLWDGDERPFPRADVSFIDSQLGKEYQLIRQLSKYREAPPRTELQVRSFSLKQGIGLGFPPSSDALNALSVLLVGVFGTVLVLLALITWMGAMAFKANSSRSWKQVLILGSAFVASFMVVLPLSRFPRIHRSGSEVTLGHSLEGASRMVHANVASGPITSAVDTWIREEGYQIVNRGEFTMNTVPEGKSLATLTLLQLWKPSWFDRWRMTTHGREPIAPELTLLSLDSKGPDESMVWIYPPMVEAGSPEGSALISILGRWEARVRGVVGASTLDKTSNLK